MTFSFTPGITITVFILLYFIFYVAYLIRIFILAKQTQNRFSPVLYKFILRSIYFSLLIISLLGPLAGTVTKEVPVVQKDLFLAVDLSESMKATDIAPNRFEKAKASIKKIVRESENCRFGLIIFTSEAFLHTPLTYDKGAIGTFTEVLSPDLIEAKGSSLDTPIQLAINSFKTIPKDQPVSKILLLISDGENFSKNLKPVLNNAKRNNISILSLGIGTQKGTEIDLNDSKVRTQLNKATLSMISNVCNGTYFEISESKNETGLLIDKINSWQSDSFKLQANEVSSNKYFYFLLFALILMVLDVLITINIIKI